MYPPNDCPTTPTCSKFKRPLNVGLEVDKLASASSRYFISKGLSMNSLGLVTLSAVPVNNACSCFELLPGCSGTATTKP